MKRKPCELGEIILDGLRETKINQSELARRCDVSRAQISSVILGKAKPSFLLFLKITRALGLNDGIHALELIPAFMGVEAWTEFVQHTHELIQEDISKGRVFRLPKE